MSEQNCANCKYSEPRCGALCCMGQKYAPYVRPTDSCDGWKSRKQTNADRIRTMTDEELAEFMTEYELRAYKRLNASGERKRFASQWLDWLKQELTE